MAQEEPSRFKKKLKKLRDSGKTKDFLVFLVFVFVAAAFWFIMTLNDEVQESFEIELKITEVPDSVTFIQLPPSSVHVAIKDRGMNLLKYKVTGRPVLQLSFTQFADANHFRVNHTELISALRNLLGVTANITTLDPDSLGLVYTTLPGKKVPVDLVYDATVSPGLVLGTPKLSNPNVLVYSTMPNDTVKAVYSEKVVLHDISKNTTVNVHLKTPSGRRVEPGTIDVTFVVEQLVKKEANISVVPDKVPPGEEILFFPAKVKVTYYVPISKYNELDDGIKLEASFNDAVNSTSDKVAIKVVDKAPYINSIELGQDNVQYTIIKNI